MVNAKTQSDEWVVNFKSWVINYTWYDIPSHMIFKLINLEIQIRCYFQLTLGCPVN